MTNNDPRDTADKWWIYRVRWGDNYWQVACS